MVNMQLLIRELVRLESHEVSYIKCLKYYLKYTSGDKEPKMHLFNMLLVLTFRKDYVLFKMLEPLLLHPFA